MAASQVIRYLSWAGLFSAAVSLPQLIIPNLTDITTTTQNVKFVAAYNGSSWDIISPTKEFCNRSLALSITNNTDTHATRFYYNHTAHTFYAHTAQHTWGLVIDNNDSGEVKLVCDSAGTKGIGLDLSEKGLLLQYSQLGGFFACDMYWYGLEESRIHYKGKSDTMATPSNCKAVTIFAVAVEGPDHGPNSLAAACINVAQGKCVPAA